MPVLLKTIGYCLMPRKTFFANVISGGKIVFDDVINPELRFYEIIGSIKTNILPPQTSPPLTPRSSLRSTSTISGF